MRASRTPSNNPKHGLVEKGDNVMNRLAGEGSGNVPLTVSPRTLCDSLELELRQAEEMTSTVVAERRRGFVVVLLRAVGLANVTAPYWS
jgi:hypothetical protein